MKQITLLGRMARDLEVSYVTVNNEQRAVGKGALACDGRGKDNTTFYNFTAWGKTAEIINQYAGRKGNMLMIMGDPKIDEYTDKDGIKRRALNVEVHEFGLCGAKNDQAQQPMQQMPQQMPPQMGQPMPQQMPQQMPMQMGQPMQQMPPQMAQPMQQMPMQTQAPVQAPAQAPVQAPAQAPVQAPTFPPNPANAGMGFMNIPAGISEELPFN